MPVCLRKLAGVKTGNMELNILLGDNIDLLKQYPDNYFDSVCTDCPYGLGKEPNALKLLQDWIDHGYHEIKGKGFMGKSWDSFVPQPLFWKEVFRVLKPGGYVLAFFGTRTYDWGTLAIRLAGFEIRDMICWHYGSGFPKNLDIGKAIDKTTGKQMSWFGPWLRNWRLKNNISQKKLAKLFPSKTGGLTGCVANWELGLNIPSALQFNTLRNEFNLPFEYIEDLQREIIGKYNSDMGGLGGQRLGKICGNITQSRTDEAKQWDGWGTALKPATEPICVARKPIDGTVAENVLKYGTGGINLDGCRMDTISPKKSFGNCEPTKNTYGSYAKRVDEWSTDKGRFPANVILDDFTSKIMDEQSGITGDKRTFRTEVSGDSVKSKTEGFGIQGGRPVGFETPAYGDTGGASRFFYCAKASQFERNAGCDHLTKSDGGFKNDSGRGIGSGYKDIQVSNFHPTVKPISLMSYLQRLVTPPGGKTLDPFAGSGTSGCSAYFENISEIVLMEMDETYLPIIEARTKYWSIERNRINYLDEIRVKKDEPIENQMKLF